jgi:hypothetical protein
MQCPHCKKEIMVPAHKDKRMIEKKYGMIRELKKEGYSYRQIVQIMGLKSTRTVSMALGKK